MAQLRKALKCRRLGFEQPFTCLWCVPCLPKPSVLHM